MIKRQNISNGFSIEQLKSRLLKEQMKEEMQHEIISGRINKETKRSDQMTEYIADPNYAMNVTPEQDNWVDIDEEIRNVDAKNKRVTVNMKDELIKMFNDDKISEEMMAVTFNISVRRIIELKKEYSNTGTIQVTAKNRHSKDFHRRKALQSQIIANALRLNPSITLKGLQQKLEEQGFWVSIASVSICLKRLGFLHRNTPVKILQFRKKQELLEERSDYSHWIQAKKNQALYFMDQCVIEADSLCRPAEDRLNSKGQIKNQKITVHLTVGFNGIVGWNIVKNQGTVSTLINHVLENYGQICDEQDILLLDIAHIHSDNEFQAFTDAKKIKTRFLPPNSSFLNPLEMIFNDLRLYLKNMIGDHQAENIEHIMNLVDDILGDYPEVRIQNFFNQMRQCCKRCQNKEDFD